MYVLMSDVPFMMLVFQIMAIVHDGKNVQYVIFNASTSTKSILWNHCFVRCLVYYSIWSSYMKKVSLLKM